MSVSVTNKPALRIESDPRQPGAVRVRIDDLHPDLIASLARHARAGRLLRSILRVRVVETGSPGRESLPDVLGRHELLKGGIRFEPYFPLDTGVRFRATFDPRLLGRTDLSGVLTVDFSLPTPGRPVHTRVTHVFPSGDALPENLLRFYVGFSNPMQRGHAAEHVALLGPDGRPAPDALYRPPVELWDRNMRYLTILLDPGRLKSGVRPNRELGPPLRPGEQYALAIGSGMLDSTGRRLQESFYKSFQVARPVRKPIATERWTILSPASKSRQPLSILFPEPLDWALLWHTIAIVSDDEKPVHGLVAIGERERRWSFTPTSPWVAGSYCIRIASGLEDVCGNTLRQAFEIPLRSASDLAPEVSDRSIPFHVA